LYNGFFGYSYVTIFTDNYCALNVAQVAFLIKMILFLRYYMAAVQTHTETRGWEDTDLLTATEDSCSLIVWNDEVNTFEWVIETLMEVCGHSEEQAEQCSMIIHTKGKYAVKEGSYEILKPQCDAITERGINATIEVFEI
jgi:ATP-dependent Clp protease adaptor protein ClpS